MFDKERTGGIAVSEMRLILSNLPEKLSDEEIDEMLRTADKGGVTMCFEFLELSDKSRMHTISIL